MTRHAGIFQKQLECAEKLSGNKSIEKQVYGQHWLGCCYFECALQANNTALFDNARTHFEAQSTQAKELEHSNSNTSIEGQVTAQVWLGQCYLNRPGRLKKT